MKKKIAVLFGGRSPEYRISLSSAYSVLSHLDSQTYDILPIGITESGDWFCYYGDYENIQDNTWAQDYPHLISAAVSQNFSTHGVMEFTCNGNRMIKLDYAFPVLHGKNGEDGTVQGLLELAGIPVIGCGTLASALCMDKDKAHTMVQSTGIAVPNSAVIWVYERQKALELVSGLRYPLFVKPARAGSSYGITKVQSPSELWDAMDTAFQHDSKIVAEEMVEGFEVGCAVMGISELTVGRVDEVQITQGFYDYDTKYVKQSVVHLPARVDDACEKRIQETAKAIYRILGCSGFARVDLFLTPSGELVFNEVNSIPGLTERSRFLSMMKAVGLEFGDILKELIAMYETEYRV